MSTSSLSEGDFAGQPPTYRLYDSRAVSIATFFGTPIAGSVLMALNYSRLGKAGKGVLTVMLATVVTVLVVLIGWNIKPGATSVIGLVLLITMQRIALYLQGPAVAAHVQRGGALGSKWIAFGLGVVFLALVFGVVFAYFMTHAKHNSVIIGTKDEVYYEDGATKEDAQALGKALKDDGFFSDRGGDVILSKGKNGTVISFIVQDGIWDSADKVDSFEEVGREVGPVVGGFPVKVRLLDTTRDVKKEMTVGKVGFPGDDEVFYRGGITETQAQTVGQSLVAADFLDGKGIVVLLSKDGGKPTISFVTNAKLWSETTLDPDVLKYFEKLARSVAPNMGGFPIRMQLVDTTLVVKKDEMLAAN